MEVDSDCLKSLVANWIQRGDSKTGGGNEQPLKITIRPGRPGIGAIVKPDGSNTSSSRAIERSLRQQRRRKERDFDTKCTAEHAQEEQESKYAVVAKLKGGCAMAEQEPTSHKSRRRKRKRKKTELTEDVPVLETSSDEMVQIWNGRRTTTKHYSKDTECQQTLRIVDEGQGACHWPCGIAVASGQEAHIQPGLSTAWRRQWSCLALSCRHWLRWKCPRCRKIKLGCSAHRLVSVYMQNHR